MQNLFPWVYNSLHAPRQEKNRLVLFAGPHKTASTSLQWFFSHNASNDLPEHRIPGLKKWSWPRYREDDNGNLLYSLNKGWVEKKLKRYEAKISDHYNQSNVIMGTENLCRFEETGSIDLILKWTNVSDPEMIVHYRTPRTDHWLSLWKQFTRIGKPAENYTFSDYLCLTDDPFPAAMDPLQLVSALLQREWRTHLIDMAGVQSDGLDITHTIACEILQVPCENGWIKGMKYLEVEKRNQRSGDANLTDSQYHALERVLQQHDCSYKSSFTNTHHLTIHHWQELWKECHLYFPSNIEKLSNFSVVVDVMREIAKCPDYEFSPSRSHLYSPEAKLDPSTREEVDQRARMLRDLNSNINFLTVLVFFACIFMLYAYRHPKRHQLTGKPKSTPKPATITHQHA